ncbi:HD domain-containing protein [Puia sp. P3]|uniref:HD domain-containing protein n=1 Tax=Puia sp. P3 TaxID=3423952 RepID=UPI003D665CE2
MNYNKYTKDTAAHIKDLFSQHPEKQFPYHNQEHTILTVLHAREIAQYYALDDENNFIVTVAAWFHDIGHLFAPLEKHEEKGAEIMTEYFTANSLPEHLIPTIAGCILATKFPSHPGTLNEQILCDADTYHFGTTYFRQTDNAVRQEFELRTGKSFPDWHKKTIALLRLHQLSSPTTASNSSTPANN